MNDINNSNKLIDESKDIQNYIKASKKFYLVISCIAFIQLVSINVLVTLIGNDSLLFKLLTITTLLPYLYCFRYRYDDYIIKKYTFNIDKNVQIDSLNELYEKLKYVLVKISNKCIIEDDSLVIVNKKVKYYITIDLENKEYKIIPTYYFNNSPNLTSGCLMIVYDISFMIPCIAYLINTTLSNLEIIKDDETINRLTNKVKNIYTSTKEKFNITFASMILLALSIISFTMFMSIDNFSYGNHDKDQLTDKVEGEQENIDVLDKYQALIDEKLKDQENNNTKPEDNNETNLKPTVDKDESSNNNNNNSQEIKYLNYNNNRYGFSISYPAELYTNINAPTNNEGCTFTAEDGITYMSVYGSNNVFNETASSMLESSLNTIPNISYKNLFDNAYVISYEKDGQIVYKYTAVGEGSYNTFILCYPKTESSKYDKIVDYVYKSFKSGNLQESH